MWNEFGILPLLLLVVGRVYRLFLLPTDIKVETQPFPCWLSLLSKYFLLYSLLGMWAFGDSFQNSADCIALLQSSPVPPPQVLLKLQGLVYRISANALRVSCLLG